MKRIDHHGLTDPLLARMPAGWVDHPRVGHFQRMGQWCVPITKPSVCKPRTQVCRFWHAYEQTLQSGRCAFEDAKLCTYYAAVREVTQAPLLSPARWRAIIALNLGELDELIDTNRYVDATRAVSGASCKKWNRELEPDREAPEP